MFDHAEYQKQRYAERKLDALARLGGCCVVCGSHEDLQFDHIDPSTKSIEVTKMFSKYSWSRILVELDKCQILCKYHHADKSAVEVKPAWNKGKRKGFEHGSLRGYNVFKCRCNLCSRAKKDSRALRTGRTTLGPNESLPGSTPGQGTNCIR